MENAVADFTHNPKDPLAERNFTMTRTFDYGYARVGQLRIADQTVNRSGRITVNSIEVDGQPARPTQRFWKSFFQRFGVADNVFRYFSPAEVFERISMRAKDDTLRYCVERDERGEASLLAVSSPKRPVIDYGDVMNLVRRYEGREVAYEHGMVRSTHVPRGGERPFAIGADDFQHRFVMETPIDGFSQPRIYLSFLRTICSNGAIGYTRAFRSDVSLGKDIGHCISRALESYDNGDGYAALRQRFESAQASWASMHECIKLYRSLQKTRAQGSVKADVISKFHRLTGNLTDLYGLANLDALSQKRQRILPAKCRVYDLINFASEAATHHADAAGNRVLQAFIGTLISDEYDMEGTATAGCDFSDFFINHGSVGPQMSLN
jgi:hypothetical protein